MRLDVGPRWLVPVVLAALGVAGAPPASAADPVLLPTYVTSGSVASIAFSGNTLYLGGTFSDIGPRTGPGVGIDPASGADLRLPQLGGGPLFSVVTTVMSDGAGGWYVGGQFGRVGGVARRNAAHILAGGSVGAWNPNVDGPVFALARSGSTVYLGGQFATAGGAARRNAAAVNATTGAVSAWDPDPNGSVSALAASGSTVYLGGGFEGAGAINGNVTRNNLAAVDATTGVVTAWNPGADGEVLALALAGTTLHAGGRFSSVGGQARDRAAAVDTATGAVTDWDPDVDGDVHALARSGSTVYLGGAFEGAGAINGTVARNHVAAVDATTGAATPWNPDADGTVSGLAVSGSTVYLAGSFHRVSGAARRSLAATDATTGALRAWNPHANEGALAVAATPAAVFAGGLFSSINAVSRRNAAAIDLSTGKPTAWNPDVGALDEAVGVVVRSGSTVYLAGSFETVNGDKVRDGLAAVDATTGTATAWAPTADGEVTAMKVSGSTVYLGGSFANVNASPRNNLAAVDAGSGLTTGWNPNVEQDGPGLDASITSLAVLGSRLYVAGFFTQIGGADRATVGSVDLATGGVNPWAPATDGTVVALAATGSTVYLGGDFEMAGGAARHNAASVNAASGAVTGWNPNFDGFVSALAADGFNVHAAGSFSGPGSVNGNVARDHLASVNPLTGVVTGWNPGAKIGVNTIASAGPDAIAAGGNAFTFGDRGAFAAYGAAPRFTAQPTGRTVADGAGATFAAAASGFPSPALQWQVSTNGGATFSDLAGRTGPTLTVPQARVAQSGSRYRARATSLAGTATSAVAALTVLAAPTPPRVTPGRVQLLTRTARIKRGIARVMLSCTGDTACTGKVRVTFRRAKGKRLRVAAGRYTIASGKRLTLKLRVSRRDRQRLFGARSRRRTTITITPTTGEQVKATLTLKAPRKTARR